LVILEHFSVGDCRLVGQIARVNLEIGFAVIFEVKIQLFALLGLLQRVSEIS
jgi:hypothetical protein